MGESGYPLVRKNQIHRFKSDCDLKKRFLRGVTKCVKKYSGRDYYKSILNTPQLPPWWNGRHEGLKIPWP